MILSCFLYFFFRKIVLHIFFWILVLLFFSVLLGTLKAGLVFTDYLSIFLLPVTMATTYTMTYYLIPDFLLKRRYFQFILYSIYILVLSAFAIVISIFYGVVFLTDMNYSLIAAPGRSILSMMVMVYLVVVLMAAFRLLKENYSVKAANKELENSILESQLKLKEQELYYLKMQIHPHFLFNTLNTIYGHALKQSEATPDMILRLSNLLDYLLYQVDKPEVSLNSELEHIRDYIALEQMRFRDSLSVHLDLPSNPTDISIPPMLLIPLVENSFKHGELKNGKLSIAISLEIDNERLIFTVKNSIKRGHQPFLKNGIGLNNLQKRLDLSYRDNNSFSTHRNDDSFEAKISLSHSKLHHYV